jgi:hypothetical protein
MTDAGMDTDTVRVRRRASRQDVLDMRAAGPYLRSLNEQIPSWQAQVAKLLASCERRNAHSQGEPALDLHLAALERSVNASLSRFDAQLASAPESVRRHSRVRDSRRAAQTVLAGIERARGMLRSPP